MVPLIFCLFSKHYKHYLYRSTARSVCFTVNNYSPEDEAELQGLGPKGLVKFIIFGKEVGASGTPHLQGYAEASSSRAFSVWRRIIGMRAYVTRAKGTRAQNTAYCSKDGDVFKYPEGDVQEESDVGYSGLLSAINAGMCVIAPPSTLRL